MDLQGKQLSLLAARRASLSAQMAELMQLREKLREAERRAALYQSSWAAMPRHGRLVHDQIILHRCAAVRQKPQGTIETATASQLHWLRVH
ncbi:MAG TPA: hypothetical protein VNZ94_17360 [Xanthobacteraceae bacterium]|nr:hypothetical protein [Xanthobacteraceae bacterium]